MRRDQSPAIMNLRRIAIVVAAAGVAGFLQPFWMWILPTEFLNRIELPNSIGSVHVTAPDGRVFIASQPFGRVQRYGPSGFERSFAIDTHGGVFDVGVSPSGHILICSLRARALITYDQDGNEIGPRGPCSSVSNQGRMPDSSYYASQAKVPPIAQSWFAAFAIPLWHPIVAWLMIAAGGLYLKFNPRSRPG
ncbi:hypothetical protein JQ604_25425 [Bradyrhizobium jicamae]|uniref:hypothetical protein n=1 Tax=Bradyrhizobium jicamae TaxID=280332 RepID=UPI001BA6BCF8|nr:hypothetical protein [Bradyrhizobium jicamae]MBR0755535.1 hypothetical protein [Bradyrhizobium jicamae]